MQAYRRFFSVRRGVADKTITELFDLKYVYFVALNIIVKQVIVA